MACTLVLFTLAAVVVVRECAAAVGVRGHSARRAAIDEEAGSCCILMNKAQAYNKMSLVWEVRPQSPCVVEHIGKHRAECNLPALEREIATSITDKGVSLGGSLEIPKHAAQLFLEAQHKKGGAGGGQDLQPAVETALLEGTCCNVKKEIPGYVWTPSYSYSLHWKIYAECLGHESLSFVPSYTYCKATLLETQVKERLELMRKALHGTDAEDKIVGEAVQEFLAAHYANAVAFIDVQKAMAAMEKAAVAAAAKLEAAGDWDFSSYSLGNAFGGSSTGSWARAASVAQPNRTTHPRSMKRLKRWAARQFRGMLRN